MLNLLLSLALLLGPVAPFSSHAQSRAGDYQLALEQLDRTMEALRVIREGIDRSSFDVDALVFELIFEDAETIAGWVTDHISWQPYRGLLRGPEGTLLERAGNALDQSVLLASLINDAGYEARVALAELSAGQAETLLAELHAPAGTTAVDRQLQDDLQEAVDRVSKMPGIDGPALQEAFAELLTPAEAPGLQQEADRTAEGLLAALAASGISLGGSLHEELLAEAREYAWVEYRLTENHPWEAAHPAAPSLADAGLEPQQVLGDSVPDDLQHRLRVEVKVERKAGDELEVLPVMPLWERPVANSIGTVLTYGNAPSGFDPAAFVHEDLLTVLDRTEFFVPNFMGSTPGGASAFDLVGALLSPEDAANPAAGVFRNVRGGFMEATSLLGGLGSGSEPEEPLALTAQWLVLTLIEPGGREREFRRTIFDRVGPEARAAGQLTLDAMTIEEAELALLTEHRIMAFPAKLPVAYRIDLLLEQLIDSRPFLEYLLAVTHGVEPELSQNEVLKTASQLEHVLAMALFDSGLANSSGTLDYRAEPGLLIFGSGFTGDRSDLRLLHSIDIVHNARRVLRSEAGRVTADPARALRQGIWETIVERELLDDDDAPGWNATTTIQRALDAGAGLKVLTPQAGVELPGLSAEARQNLQLDLDAGYVVVLPDSFAAADRGAWWRVQPETGEALGITADGRGQVTAEYTIKTVNYTMGLLFTLINTHKCNTSGLHGIAQACCLARVYINGLLGFGLGKVLTAGFGTAAAGLAATTTRAATGLDFTGFTCEDIPEL